jgi:hypothetical protein
MAPLGREQSLSIAAARSNGPDQDFHMKQRWKGQPHDDASRVQMMI